MKQFLLFLILSCFAQVSYGQLIATPKISRFGIAVNNSISLNPGNLSIAPTGTFYKNSHQIELGIALFPIYRKTLPLYIGAEINYKYFVHGIDKRFNHFFVANTTYTSVIDKHTGTSSYKYVYNYLRLTAGYGFEIKFLKSAFIGMNLNAGVYSRSLTATGETTAVHQKMFDRFLPNASLNLNIGYRFKQRELK